MPFNLKSHWCRDARQPPSAPARRRCHPQRPHDRAPRLVPSTRSTGRSRSLRATPVSRAAAGVRDVAAALASAVASPTGERFDRRICACVPGERPPRVPCSRAGPRRLQSLGAARVPRANVARRSSRRARAARDDVALAARTYDEVLEWMQSRFEPGANLRDVVAELALEQLERVAQRRRLAAAAADRVDGSGERAAAAQHAEGCSIHPASACFEQLTTYPSQSRSVGGSSARRHAGGQSG